MLAQAELGRSLARTILRFTIPRKIDEGPALRALSVCASLGLSDSHGLTVTDLDDHSLAV